MPPGESEPLVAVTTYYDRDLIGPALAPLRERAEVRFGPPVGRNLQASELVEALAGAAAVIAADERYDTSILAAVPALRIIAREGAGYNGIDVAEATQRGIAVTNAPVVHEATATMALGLMFALVRKLLICDRAVRAGRWTDRGLFLNPGLDGLTLGLIGFGMIGRGVARRALPCGLRVLAHSRSLTAEEAEPPWRHRRFVRAGAGRFGHRQPARAALRGDQRPDRRGRAGRHEARRLPDQHLPRAGGRRGGAHRCARLRASGRRRPGRDGRRTARSGNPLLSMEQVVLSPHMGGDTERTMVRAVEVACDNVLACLDGRTPPTILNPEVLNPPA